MKEKFLSLLTSNAKWQIIFNNVIYDANYFKKLLAKIMKNWELDKIYFDKNSYVIAVGWNHFDYIVYIFLASLLGLRIILCDPKMLQLLITEYHLSFQYIISTQNLDVASVPLLKIDTQHIEEDYLEKIILTTDQAEIIFFTSGTTSLPKLVVYEENNLLQNGKKVGNYLGIKIHDTCLSLFPVNYMYGFSMFVSTISQGGTLILERSTITSQEIIDYLHHYQIKILPVIHSVLVNLINHIKNHPEYFENLTIINASDKIYINDVKNIFKICPVFWNNFGQTEAGPRIFSLRLSKQDNLSQYCYKSVVALGKPIDEEIELLIKDNLGRICGINEIGELNYRSPYAMKGYLNTEGKINKRDWIASGDLVYRNPEGNIFWVGRKNETIKLKGKFINISLLHTNFDRLDLVKKSYFFVDPDTKDLNAVFVPKIKGNNHSLKNDLFKSYRDLFPHYPRVKNMFFIDELPTTLSGKVKLRELNNLCS